MASNAIINDIETSSTNVKAEVDNEENRNDDNDKQKKFVPPPEYDENDSRWTLKYREPAPGLVELVKHSCVYVNFDKLTECQKWSNDCKTFAANLLTEIFTDSALTTCTWSGLDQHATNILLQFVAEYGQIREWIKTDYQCIIKGIRQVMLEMKCARKKKEEKAEEEPLNENGSQKHLFLLPPEYDKNNSRWTLKYREYAPGLVELIYDSCVYIEIIQLAKCKRLAKDSITLARMLLPEIFKKSALSVCSVTGDAGTNKRLGLDENAMRALLKFIAENEKKNRWMETESKCILSSIQQKLELLRRVKRKEQQEKEEVEEKQEEQEVEEKQKEQEVEEKQKELEEQEVEDEEEEEQEEEEEEYDSDLSDSFCFLKEISSQDREFRNLPPEYDANDSRWTLKYREPAPGLVELVEHSGVYVNADKLAECKRLSNDCPTLARKLLTEIFTRNALGTCSLSKRNHKCYKTYCETLTTTARFGLHYFQRPKPELDALLK